MSQIDKINKNSIRSFLFVIVYAVISALVHCVMSLRIVFTWSLLINMVSSFCHYELVQASDNLLTATR